MSEYFSISLSQMMCGTSLYKQIMCREMEILTVCIFILCVILRAYCVARKNSLYMILCSNGGRKNSLVRFSAAKNINLTPDKEEYVLRF